MYKFHLHEIWDSSHDSGKKILWTESLNPDLLNRQISRYKLNANENSYPTTGHMMVLFKTVLKENKNDSFVRPDFFKKSPKAEKNLFWSEKQMSNYS